MNTVKSEENSVLIIKKYNMFESAIKIVKDKIKRKQQSWRYRRKYGTTENNKCAKVKKIDKNRKRKYKKAHNISREVTTVHNIKPLDAIVLFILLTSVRHRSSSLLTKYVTKKITGRQIDNLKTNHFTWALAIRTFKGSTRVTFCVGVVREKGRECDFLKGENVSF